MKSLAHYGPVTALEFVGEFLFVGEGPRLKKYHWKTGKLVSELRVFPRDKIHGMCVNQDFIAVWGGKTLAVLDREGSIVGSSKRLHDWICSAAFAKSMDNTWLYIQTAHNSIICINKDFQVVDIVGCGEESVLYSGSILPLENDALIGAGTVLEGVVTWRLSDRKVLHRFTSHEGSIFGIEFSQDGRRAVSCSDDRSIRLWDMETGEQLATGWGHMGRIWQMMFVNDKIVSISEDCSARLWQLNGSTLECEQVYEGHLGRNAWCGAINYDSLVLATGGGDGRIRLWDIKRHQDVAATRIEDVWGNIPQIQKSESLKEYTVVKNGIISGTSKSRILMRKNNGEWLAIDDVPADTHSCVQGMLNRNMVFVGKGDGHVTELKVNEDGAEIIRTRKVDVKGRLNVVLPFERKGELYYLVSSQNPNDAMYMCSVGSERIVTVDRPNSFQPKSLAYDEDNCTLYVGSRHGAIAAFPWPEADDGDALSSTKCLRRLMSEDAVTSIVVYRSRIYATSRLGEYCALACSDMELLYMSRLPKGLIMGCAIVEGNLLLYGFRTDYFFIWDDTTQCEIMTEKCGGAHRNWSLVLDSEDCERYKFVYTKTSSLFITENHGKGNCSFQHTVIQQGTHGREIRAIEISPTVLTDGTRIIATASEDTCVRFCTLTETDAVLRTHVIQRQHVSGMQSVHWTPNGKFLLSSAANEELIVWKVTVEDNGHVFACMHSKLPTSIEVPDLRIMDFAMLELSDDQYILATIYSDSAIKLWMMDLREAKFQLLAQGTYSTWCLLNCDFVVSDSTTYVVVSSTDGHLAAYDVSGAIQGGQFPEKALSLQLHQSSVKASLLRRLPDGRYMHISGGDDNALCVALLTFGKGEVHGEKVCENRDAHIATITAVAQTETGFVTTSVDQVVKHWQIGESNQIELLEEQYTTVADTGPLDTCKTRDNKTLAVFGGSGLSVWQC